MLRDIKLFPYIFNSPRICVQYCAVHIPVEKSSSILWTLDCLSAGPDQSISWKITVTSKGLNRCPSFKLVHNRIGRGVLPTGDDRGAAVATGFRLR